MIKTLLEIDKYGTQKQVHGILKLIFLHSRKNVTITFLCLIEKRGGGSINRGLVVLQNTNNVCKLWDVIFFEVVILIKDSSFLKHCGNRCHEFKVALAILIKHLC